MPESRPPKNPPILSEFGSAPEMAELVEQFVGELPARVGEMLDHWRAQNFAEVQRGAHQLKGASAGYGFPSIGLAASKVESSLRGQSTDQVIADAERIAAHIRALAALCGRASAA